MPSSRCVETQSKNRLQRVLEFLRDVDHFKKALGTSTGGFQGDALHGDISHVGQGHALQTERQCLDAKTDTRSVRHLHIAHVPDFLWRKSLMLTAFNKASTCTFTGRIFQSMQFAVPQLLCSGHQSTGWQGSMFFRGCLER